MDEQAAAVWRERIERQRASGLGLMAWCAQEGVDRRAMWAWRRRLGQVAEKPAARRRGAAARRHWEQVLRQQARSGLSMAAFCRRRGLCAPQLFAWRKRLQAPAASAFLEVRAKPLEPKAATAPIELVLGCGRRLCVRPGFDPDHLRALLEVLEVER